MKTVHYRIKKKYDEDDVRNVEWRYYTVDLPRKTKITDDLLYKYALGPLGNYNEEIIEFLYEKGWN